MENIVLSRLILGFVCFVNVFVGYAGLHGFVRKAINRKVWIAAFVVEVFLITAYIVFDNVFVDCHPDDGWLMAILGYLVVYNIAFMAWFSYRNNTRLEKGKSYKFHREQRMTFDNRIFVSGYVMSGSEKVDVFLEISNYKEDVPNGLRVKFKAVEQGYILVSRVD